MTNDSDDSSSGVDRVRRHPSLNRAEFEARVREGRDKFEAANNKVTARTGRNLINAIGIGLGLGLVLVLSLVVVKQIYIGFAAVLMSFTVFELASALRHAGRDVPRIPTVVATVGIVAAAAFAGPEGQWLATLGGILLVCLWRVAELVVPRHRAPLRSVALDLTGGVFIQVYVSFLGSISVLLLRPDGGEWWVLAFLVTVVSVDVGAYVSGLNFGKHLMAPTISPKKTWEGFIGSWIFGVVASILLSVFMLQMPWWFGVIFGTTLVLAATIGDLSESLLKRDLGIKDMSTWLPGHGGFLDRLDSMLPSAAAAYVLFMIFT